MGVALVMMGEMHIALVKKRWQEYTEELYKRDLHDSDNHDGVIVEDEKRCEDVKGGCTQCCKSWRTA